MSPPRNNFAAVETRLSSIENELSRRVVHSDTIGKEVDILRGQVDELFNVKAKVTELQNLSEKFSNLASEFNSLKGRINGAIGVLVFAVPLLTALSVRFLK